MTMYNRTSSVHGRTKARRRIRGLLLWLLCLLIAGLGWCFYVLAEIGSVDRNPAAGEFTSTVDVGIVLGASMWGDHPSPGLQERLQQALQDYKDGRFRYFLLTGGLDRPEYQYTEAEGMANYLEANGVSRDKMFLENRATSTYENLKFSQDIMKEQGLKSAVIITHTYHGNRAFEIAKTLGYENPRLSLKETEVLKPVQTVFREILAYSKWKLDQASLALGWK